MIKNNFKPLLGILALLIIFSGCKKKTYTLGDLTAPTNLVITTEVVGQNTANPNGDGSGDVKITITADNALSYKVDYDASDAVDLVFLPTGSITKKYAKLGTNTYKITAVVYGKGGTSSTITKDVTVKFNYVVDPLVVTNLTGDASKTWGVDKSIPAHFGVGPWSGSSNPEWWSAAVNEKVACCNCFYTSSFKFTKVNASTFTLQVTSPDGAFTKTGALANGLPGIPGSGDEGCYSGYTGGTSSFSFLPSAIRPGNVVIAVGGTNTFIGYGAVQKEYEILALTATSLYLRVQGTETGNAWYIKLKAL